MASLPGTVRFASSRFHCSTTDRASPSPWSGKAGSRESRSPAAVEEHEVMELPRLRRSSESAWSAGMTERPGLPVERWRGMPTRGSASAPSGMPVAVCRRRRANR